jgi:hypothetical protein
MLRMMLLGLLIPLGVGVLSAMELRTPPRSAVATVQPIVEPNADTSDAADSSDSHEALAKGDRLEVVSVRSEPPQQPVPIDESAARPEDNAPPEGNALPEDSNIGSAEPPKPIVRHRHNPKPKKVTTAARPKSKPKASVIKRSAISQRSKAASDSEPCRLKEFGGLRKALNSTDCEL